MEGKADAEQLQVGDVVTLRGYVSRAEVIGVFPHRTKLGEAPRVPWVELNRELGGHTSWPMDALEKVRK
jgi:hypothetical protein